MLEEDAATSLTVSEQTQSQGPHPEDVGGTVGAGRSPGRGPGAAADAAAPVAAAAAGEVHVAHAGGPEVVVAVSRPRRVSDQVEIAVPPEKVFFDNEWFV